MNAEDRAVMNEIAFKAAQKTVEAFEDKLKAEVIPETVKETLKTMGVDADNLGDVQDDFRYLRKQREKSERRNEYIAKAFWTAVVGLAIAAITAQYLKG